MPPKVLASPNNSFDNVESRRDACHGSGPNIYLNKNPQLEEDLALLTKIRDEITALVDPERTPENGPRKLPGYIKVKSLHAAFWGYAPFLNEEDNTNYLKSELKNGESLFDIRDVLKKLMTEKNFRLTPNMTRGLDPTDPKVTQIAEEGEGLEFNGGRALESTDGTIMARYNLSVDGDDDLVPTKELLNACLLNPPTAWDKTPLRNKTTTVVLAVVAMTGYQFKLEEPAEEIKEKTIHLYIDIELGTVMFKLKTPEGLNIHEELKLDEEKIHSIKECLHRGELTSKATNWINKELSGKKYIPVRDPVLEQGIREILSKHREEFKNLRNKSLGIIEDITVEKSYNKRTHTIDKPTKKKQHVNIFCEVRKNNPLKARTLDDIDSRKSTVKFMLFGNSEGNHKALKFSIDDMHVGQSIKNGRY